MTKEECENIQESIITGLDGYPDILIDEMCQVAVDFLNQTLSKA